MSLAATARPAFVRRSLTSKGGSAAAIDAALGVGAFVLSLVLGSHHVDALRPGPSALDWTSGVLIAGSTLPLIGWRRSPRLVFVTTALVSALLGGLGYSLGLILGPTVALYLWAASREATSPWSRADTEVVVSLFAVYLGASAIGDRGFPSVELMHTGLAFAVAWFAGERTRLRREHIADLEERARRAEQDAEREQRLALAEERARIARDLHDSVGHAINVVAVRAGAARLRYDVEPGRSRAALEAIEAIARQTAGEIDEIVSALRDPSHDDGELFAPVGLASVPTLVEHHAASGLAVDVSTRGSRPVLDPGVDVAAYRIVQEALTNAARHGTGSADLEIAFHDSAVDLTISNPVRDPAPPATNRGHGLAGMRERAALLGGTLDASCVEQRFHVRARLPYHAPSQ